MRRYWLISAGMLLVFLAAFLVVEAAGPAPLTDPDTWLKKAGPGTAALSVGLLVGDVFLPVPSSVLMIGNGALFGVALGTILSLLGSLGATALGFFLGRRGASLIERLATPAQKDRADALLARWGALAILITRPIPLLAETTAILAGASPLGWGRVLLAALAGAFPGSLLYALTGATSQSFGSGVLMFAFVLLIAGGFYYLGRLS
jgi:uncharacterized membrane protein YdjX (TVP38/TMEM64 family)